MEDGYSGIRLQLLDLTDVHDFVEWFTDKTGEIGYVLASGYWGKGIATKAVKLVASTIIVECPHLERLEALVDVENIGSQKVSEKVGFSRDGVLRKYWILKGKPRDMVMFSLLSTDPQINYFRYD
ncbi:hypothetical protein ACH5RR_033320 [Cinchona calisaya]|uniref:N-acetyltransferase domain-containing protein n=1 Tax=Cinchona calisaya TaxID=153742 RepID=A0ABD2YLS7_9GENT